MDLHLLYIGVLGATNYEALFVHISQKEFFPLNNRAELKAAGWNLADFSSIPGYFEDN